MTLPGPSILPGPIDSNQKSYTRRSGRPTSMTDEENHEEHEFCKESCGRGVRYSRTGSGRGETPRETAHSQVSRTPRVDL